MPELDRMQQSVLDRMERADRLTRYAIIGAAVMEGLLFVLAFVLVDWSDSVHRLLFVLSVLSYTILALGLIALGGHITRSTGRILTAMERS